MAALAFVGASSVSFIAIGNATLQLAAAPQMRGRVMALWFVAFQGSTPIGGPLVGWIIAAAGARVGLGVGGVTCLVVAALGVAALRHWPSKQSSVGPPRVASGTALARR